MRFDHFTDFFNVFWSRLFFPTMHLTYSKTMKPTGFIFSPIQSRNLIIFKRFYCPLPTCGESPKRGLHIQSRKYSKTTSTSQSLTKVQSLGVFKELSNGDMNFGVFYFSSPFGVPHHSQGQLMGERSSIPSLGNIVTLIYKSLNAFEQLCSALDPLDCCKMPTMPPNMASPTTKRVIPIILHPGRAHTNELNCNICWPPIPEIVNTVGYDSANANHFNQN
jgi:hypothetical protein